MFGLIKDSISTYVKNPLQFALVSLYWVLLQFLLIAASAGLFLLMVFLISLFGLSEIAVFEYAFIGICGLLLFCFSAGAYGAYIRSVSYVMNGQPPDFMGFFRYALTRSPLFFAIEAAKAVPCAIFLVVPAALFFYVKNVQYVDAVAALLALAGLYLAGILTFLAPFSAALYDTKALVSMKNSLKALRNGHIFTLILFGIYAAVLSSLLIPVVGIITLFVTLPITMVLAVLFSQKYIRR